MRYLVNRETKEHYIQPGMMVPYGPVYDEVEADSEGWIPFCGGDLSPVPSQQVVEVCGNRHEKPSRNPGWAIHWMHVTQYRPILTEQSEPEMPFGDKNLWIEESGQIEQSVFDRLASAVSASESIPALIAEINAMLPEGYMVARIGVDMAKGADWTPEPSDDMSDWRNWREGDILECLDGNGWTLFKTGEKYPFDKEGDGKDGHIKLSYVTSFPADFRWHSRPTGASK